LTTLLLLAAQAAALVTKVVVEAQAVFCRAQV
jgi:hypothetical protein